MGAQKDQDLKHLARALVVLKTTGEAKKFLRDLMTDQELEECAQRWKVARMLHQKISYSQIENETSMSSTTIARISKWLQEGAGGYNLILRRLGRKKK